jgi:hypothetical protein
MGYGTWGFLWGERIEAQFRAGAAVRNGVGLPDPARYAAGPVLLPPEGHEFVNKSRLSKALAHPPNFPLEQLAQLLKPALNEPP